MSLRLFLINSSFLFQEREEYTAGASFSNMAEVAQRPAGEQIVMVASLNIPVAGAMAAFARGEQERLQDRKRSGP